MNAFFRRAAAHIAGLWAKTTDGIRAQKPINRIITTAYVLSVAVFCGATAALLGSGLRPSGLLEIKNVGIMQLVRMPAGSRRLEDIHSFQLKSDGGSDYMRIFVNNYATMSNESADDLGPIDGGPPNFKLKDAIAQAVDRGDYRLGTADIRNHLHNGRNYVVLELENGYMGCSAQIDMTVNGIELEGFPERLPDKTYFEKAAVNTDLVKRLEFIHGDARGDSVCVRRIWEIDIE